jgi:enoyl-CoA hydratase/carnithine racemase
MLLKGSRYTGPEALEAGLVDAVAPSVLQSALELATPLAHKAVNRRTFGILKRELNRRAVAVLDRGIQLAHL